MKRETGKERLHNIRKHLKTRINFYRALYAGPRAPLLSRVLLWAAPGYNFCLLTLFPIFIPVLGHIDDVVIISTLILIALKFMPPEVCREEAVQQ
ncbi:MAG: hypothetical protein H0Z35_08595 [Thermoanaerobacteraceae bacterium]|nr:hypothetical protein [Thermoanaerobacteraceae bacterium]